MFFAKITAASRTLTYLLSRGVALLDGKMPNPLPKLCLMHLQVFSWCRWRGRDDTANIASHHAVVWDFKPEYLLQRGQGSSSCCAVLFKPSLGRY